MIWQGKREQKDDREQRDIRREKKIPLKKKICKFCADGVKVIDYKDVNKLMRFITERGKIIPSRNSGNCDKHQRQIASAIKRARNISLLPFVRE